jgi:hypothetical protein
VVFNGAIVRTIAAFLESLDIPVRPTRITHATLVPGVDIHEGGLIVDEPHLLRQADILHEGGHLAITPRALRRDLYGKIGSSPADEMTTIAWCWAAIHHLGIAPEELFHDQVISGNGPTLLENFLAGRYVGVPMLRRLGMTVDYPRMVRWTRD